MKIALITDSIEKIQNENLKEGGGVVAREITKELLSRKDIELTLIVPKIRTDFNLCNVIFINNTVWEEEFIKEVDEIIKKSDFDMVLNINTKYPYGLYFIQCQSYQYRVNNNNFLFKIIKSIISKKKIKEQEKTYKLYDADYIAVSNKVKEDYSQNLNIHKDKIRVIYPAISEKFRNSSQNIEQNNTIRMGIVAGSAINKGGYNFVIAIGLLKLSGIKINAEILAYKHGKDIIYKFLISLFRLNKQIHFVENSTNIYNFYNSIDCLVLPSLNEAFGLVALESMAMGRPVIASSTTGVSEIITENSSFVFNRKSFKDYLLTLKKVYNIYKYNFNEYKKYSENSKLLAEEYSWKTFTDKLLYGENL